METTCILYLSLLFITAVTKSEATTLTVSNSRAGAICVGDHLLFTCAANQTTFLSWFIEHVFNNDSPLSFGLQDNTGKTFSRNGFTATLTYIAPVNMQEFDVVSTLEVIVNASLNGSRVWCYTTWNDNVFYDIFLQGSTVFLYDLNYTVLHSGLLNVTVCITWNMNSQSDTTVNEFTISIYSADTEYTIPIHSNETKAILTLSYNIRYNISVTTIDCGEEIKADNEISFLKIGCDQPKSPESGAIKPYHSLAEGSEIFYHCNTGYAPHEEMTAVCTHQGVWSHNPNGLECLRDCGVPYPLLNGYVEPYNSTVEGGEVFYQCREGSSPSDVRMRAVCTAEGVWNPNPTHFSCTGSDLSKSTPLGKHIVISVTTVGSILFFLILVLCVPLLGALFLCWRKRHQRTTAATNEPPLAMVTVSSDPLYEEIPTQVGEEKFVVKENAAYAPRPMIELFPE